MRIVECQAWECLTYWTSLCRISSRHSRKSRLSGSRLTASLMNLNSEGTASGCRSPSYSPGPMMRTRATKAHIGGTARLGATTPKNLVIVCCGFAKLAHFLIDSASICEVKIISKRNNLCIILNRLTKLASCLKYVRATSYVTSMSGRHWTARLANLERRRNLRALSISPL